MYLVSLAERSDSGCSAELFGKNQLRHKLMVMYSLDQKAVRCRFGFTERWSVLVSDLVFQIWVFLLGAMRRRLERHVSEWVSSLSQSCRWLVFIGFGKLTVHRRLSYSTADGRQLRLKQELQRWTPLVKALRSVPLSKTWGYHGFSAERGVDPAGNAPGGG
ncbi:hypothetical protein F511_35433 [Dorcoceras hygrometricum]|uniref:Uncharacterized protein n=1 Tax=Dorcoceras hygrometricum TaxID=472368 RepID=A0A2Z7AWY5_9LAMI|nr:hypothetical protein F511_35433 [Dorcoceras hygrometricum]